MEDHQIVVDVHFVDCEPDCAGHSQSFFQPESSESGGALAEFDAAAVQMQTAYGRAEAALERYSTAEEVLTGRAQAERGEVLARMQGYNEIADKWKMLVIRHERLWAKMTPPRNSNQFIKAGESAGIPRDTCTLEPTKKQAQNFRQVESIEDEVFEKAAVQVLADGDVTRAAVLRAAERISNPEPEPEPAKNRYIGHTTGDEEWYTPAEYIEAARKALGGKIGLDPASCATAQEVVDAEVYYTIEDDGLEQDWRARTLFINPPFASRKINAFADKLLGAYQTGRVESAVWLSNNNTETDWFQKLFAECACAFFPSTRIRFWRTDRDVKVAAGMVGQVFLYLGRDPAGFQSAFAEFGGVFAVCQGGEFRRVVERAVNAPQPPDAPQPEWPSAQWGE